MASQIRRLIFYVAMVLLCAFLILPSLVVVPMSFNGSQLMQFPPTSWSLNWYNAFFASAEWMRATRNSFVIAGAVAVVTTALGTMAAIALVGSGKKLTRVSLAVLLSPMLVPTIVSSLGFYSVLSKLGLVGTLVGLIAAHTVLALPFVIVNVMIMLKGLDPRLAYAARSLGASPTKTFFTVTLPVIRPGVIAGAVFSFITSFDEVVAALFLSGVNSRTLPVQMWSGLLYEVNPIVAAASTLLLALSTTALLASRGNTLAKDR